PALCVQAREGRLHVFLPYTTKLTDYLDLVSSIEDTCTYLEQPVWLEGYPPPSDPRLRSFSVTPDPGVIEINLPPARNWDELQSINELVFEQADATRLTAQKFLYDGRQATTGGGNHIVIGGPTAADSPVLRRPDLLRSMLLFWQNHPSLSYLFSGAFVGPTSQHPRVDEARMESLYELEIAFQQLPPKECPPWLVDRLFRNLLVDMTGNTHRAEFCIDKLYPPQDAGLRLGLLELRAFEMAPNLRMQLIELLLIRALVAAFWKTPYIGSFIRWGTALHDRFFLPHFIKQDLLEVLAFLRQSGYAFDPEWFAAQLEFRFPKIGSVALDGIQLELRHGLEPWHVLGEEADSTATVRPVDFSLERLQVKVSGWIESRHAAVCNHRRVPLYGTGAPGEAVAGVRYRAWQPASCLHPTIPVHSPLVFDVVDLWNTNSLGGCFYHVMHPAGRPYTNRPSNADEAQNRRSERFQPFGDRPAPAFTADEDTNSVYPMTLDLRRASAGETTPATVNLPAP
ncbi:MAG: transglutaminase family protein, partial [Acidobacteriaceae bacterium]|nr:transglutaminase family protein [Acidobacteriaceae bacterium]